jgi:protein-S-isoprenylcysteine O-methyltransferase Ste14
MLKLIPPVWAAIYLALAGAASAIFPWRAIVDLRILWFGAVLIAAGAAFAISAALLFRAEQTEINPMSETNRRLVIRGPYRLTRNPMYLGLVLATLGIAFCVGSLPMFAVPLLVFATTNQVHIPFEEAKMRRQFGAAYDRYTRETRRWV